MIIFAETRYKYDSYLDFWKFVRVSSFPVIYVDEIQWDKDVTYIIPTMNGEYRPHIDDLRKKFGYSRDCSLIFWNLERPGHPGSGLGSEGLPNFINENNKLIDQGYVDLILSSCPKMAEDAGLFYMPYGSVKLGEPCSKEEKMYDFVTISCYSGNRAWMFQDPGVYKKSIKGMTIADGVRPERSFGDLWVEEVMRSKIMLATHQDNDCYIEPMRYACAAAYGLPILAESICKLTIPYTHGICVVTDKPGYLNYENIVSAMEYMLYNYDWYNEGLALREVMTGEYSFRNCIEKFLPENYK